MLKQFLCTLLVLLYSFPALSDAPQSIAIVFEDEGKVDVLYHRAMSTSTGAVIGGLIGAAVEEGVRDGKDDKKLALILPHLRDPVCTKQFLLALTEKLEAGGYQPMYSEDSQSSPLILQIDIDSCGFKMVNTSTQKVSAFISFEAKLMSVKKREPELEEKFYLNSKEHYQFEELVATSEKIQPEFDLALEKAGRRLANKIIYRR